MSILRLWVIGAAFVAALLLLGGWFLGVQPRLAEAAAANTERQGVATVNAQYEAVLVELRELSENLPQLERELEDLRVEIPQAPELSTLLGQLNQLAEASGVALNEVNADPPVLIAAEQLEPLGITDLVGIPVRVGAIGPPEGLAEFMKAAQFGPRLMWVGRFSTGDDADTGKVTLEGYIFVLPEEGAALPAVDAGAVEDEQPATEPSGEPSAAPSSEPSASPSP